MVEPNSDQAKFWDSWIEESSAWEANPDNFRRAEVVMQIANRRKRARILEIGCGSGWLSLKLSKLGEVTAIDIGVQTMERLKTLHPHIRWIGGDFLDIDLPRGFDLIVTMETIAHVPSQTAFARKIADLASGDLVLTTQNPFVWNRVSTLKAPQPGQLRDWPSRNASRVVRPLFRA